MIAPGTPASTRSQPHLVAPLPRLSITGVPVVHATSERALAAIERSADGSEPVMIAFANAHSCNLAARDLAFRHALLSATYVLNDGIGVAIAAKLWGAPFPENLNGSDLSPRLLYLAARRGWSVFLLGGRPHVAERAATRLRADMPSLQIAGTAHGFHDPVDDGTVADSVARSGADLLLVGMGQPRQEQWLHENLRRTGARVGVAVGAFLDFSAGEVPRAPAWMNRHGVEWVWRLAHEPRRLARRYLVGNPEFMARALRDRSLHTR